MPPSSCWVGVSVAVFGGEAGVHQGKQKEGVRMNELVGHQ
jgi:hypothetical protein